MSISMRELQGFGAMPHLAQRRAVYGPFGNGLGRHTTWGPNPCFTGCKPAGCTTIVNVRCGCPGPCGAHGTAPRSSIYAPPPPPVYDTPVTYDPPFITNTPVWDPPTVTQVPVNVTQVPVWSPTTVRMDTPVFVPPTTSRPVTTTAWPAVVGDTTVAMPTSQAAAVRPVPGTTSSAPVVTRGPVSAASMGPLGPGMIAQQTFQPMQARRSYVPGGTESYSANVSGLGGGKMPRNGNGTPFAYANPAEFANVGKPRPQNGGTFTLDELAAAGFVIGSPYEPGSNYGGPSAVAFQQAKPNQGGAQGSSLSMDELAAAGFDVGPAYDPRAGYGGPSAARFQALKPNEGGAQGSNLGNERVNMQAMILRDFGGVPPGPFQTEVARAPVYRADGVVLEPLALTGERF